MYLLKNQLLKATKLENRMKKFVAISFKSFDEQIEGEDNIHKVYGPLFAGDLNIALDNNEIKLQKRINDDGGDPYTFILFELNDLK